MPENIILKVNNLSVVKEKKVILHNISFELKKGQLLSIVGKNGAGKSTLCKVITNNLQKTKGEVIKEKNLNITYVPQIHDFNSFVPIQVKDFICLGLKDFDGEKYLYLLDCLGLKSLEQSSFHALSGGEKQKVILLRALLKTPDLLVLDEPVSFVDFASRGGVYDIIEQLRKKENFSVVMVSHDVNLVLKNTDWVLCLNEGKIGCQGNNISVAQSSIFNENLGVYQHQENKVQ
jgi:zinc transport system ATP-binding protein